MAVLVGLRSEKITIGMSSVSVYETSAMHRIIISVYFPSSKFTHDLNGMDFLLSRTFPDSCIDLLRLLSLNQRLLFGSLHPPHHHRVSWASRTLNPDDLCRGDVGHLHCLHYGIHQVFGSLN